MGDVSNNEWIGLRRARPSDAESLARLATQLSYPSTPDQIEQRIAAIEENECGEVFVAELAERGVVGWIHIYGVYLPVVEPHAELGGLVVEDASRGMGIGQALLSVAEQWAQQEGFSRVSVHSNVIRTRAHRFYERLGYQQVKEQKVYGKDLV